MMDALPAPAPATAAQPATPPSASASPIPPAPAAPPSASTTPASDAAVVAKDVAAYREARRVERGDPARTPPVSTPSSATPDPAAAAAPPSGADAPPVSRRQQTIATFQSRIAELEAENTRLKAPAAPAAPSAPASGPGAPERIAIDIAQPALEEAAFYTKYPHASTTEYIRYLNHFDRQVERATEQMRTAQHTAAEAAHARATKFYAQVTAAGDPAAVLERIDPALTALETRAFAQAQGKPVSAANDLADEILDSEVAVQVLEHLTAHPDVRAQLLAQPNRRALVREFTRLEAQFTPAATPAPLKTMTDAPAPAVILGARSAPAGDPADRAVIQGDVAAYRAARLAQRAATLTR